MSFVSTTTPLSQSGAANNADRVVIGPFQTATADSISGVAISDKVGDLYIEQSGNGGKNWDISKKVTLFADVGTVINESLPLPLTRIRLVNTASSAQTYLRIYARTTSAGAR